MDPKTYIDRIKNKAVAGKRGSQQDCLKLLSLGKEFLPDILSAAGQIQKLYRGKKVSTCSITSAKTGNCSEDCTFCGQSSNAAGCVNSHPLIDKQQMLEQAGQAFSLKAERFCFVTSGLKLSSKEFAGFCQGARLIKKRFPSLCLDASLGLLTVDQAKELKLSGISRYNHNLETSERFFPFVCKSHTFSQRYQTALAVKTAGLELCSGGIFGLGEDWLDRLNLAFCLSELSPCCIPINFLNPIKGTPLENANVLNIEECLKIIAIFRFIHPEKEIKVCGGREAVLKQEQSRIYDCGADSIIIGNYLTTRGNACEEDLKTILQKGFYV